MPASIPTSSSTPFSLRARSASFNPSARCRCFPQLFKRFKHNTNMEKLSFVLIIIILLIFQSIGFFFLFRFFLFFLVFFLFFQIKMRWNIVEDRRLIVDEYCGRILLFRSRLIQRHFSFFFFSGSFYNS